MRLVCPNCEAKYEVPDDAIPETGRDVQCANCGHAWFQMRQKTVAAVTEPVPAKVEEKAAEPVTETVPAKAEETAAEQVTETVPEKADETAAEPETVAAETATEAAPPSPVPETAVAEPEPAAAAETMPTAEGDGAGAENKTPAAAYAVDDSVLAILREEADREAIARKADARTLETQPDLGIDAALSPTEKRAAMLKGEEIAAGKPSARRDLLPDVEEINSTLRPSEQQAEEAPVAEVPVVVAEKRGGFRSGFLAVMTLAILGMALYISAPHLGSAVPALVEPLDAYVSFIDGLRLQLDGLMKSATVAINGEAG